MPGLPTPPPDPLSEALRDRARAEGFDPVGIARIPGSPRMQLRTEALQRWLNAGYQADMGWMAAPRRLDPEGCSTTPKACWQWDSTTTWTDNRPPEA